jgi:hypothetical protein
MALSSPGAVALRVHFTGFHLPERTGVYLYTDDGQTFGPYTGRGPLGDGSFWSHTVVGDTVLLQLRFVGQASDADLRGAGFTVAGLGHLRPNFMSGTCGDNADCVLDANCTNTDPAVEGARNAIAHMEWISGPYIYMCTGGLLADSDDGSQIPYFLTANHCISKGKDARNLENFFQYATDPKECPAACPSIYELRDNYPQSLRTLGASIVSTGRNADYTLLQLNEPAPDGSTFLGWNADPVAYSDGKNLFRISHPQGSPQSYSEHDVDTSAPTCQSWPRGDRIYSRDVRGATEGGSSGSPVLNADSQVVGQLSGACGTNLGDVCDSANNATVDGAFAAYYDQVSQWLGSSSGGGCTPETEVCDGIDNNCDGTVDEGCPVDGLPPGADCSDNNQCASNKCTGRPNYKTCK